MSGLFKKAFRIYKYLSLVFVIGFCIHIVIDDYVFIEQISTVSDSMEFLGLFVLYLFVYGLIFSIYYWLFSLLVIFVCHKFFKAGLAKVKESKAHQR